MRTEGRDDACRYFEGLFSPYIEGELDGPERRALAEHLHDCEECSEQFGLTWRAEATRHAARRRKAGTTKAGARAAKHRVLLWLVMLGSLAGVLALGTSGMLDGERREPGLLPERNLVSETIAELVSVQTSLLKALVDPLRGSNQHISHTARGQARDYFDALGKLAGADLARVGRSELAPLFHRYFRAAAPEPGGRDWDRSEFLERLGNEGMPLVVLVEVRSAFKDTILCQVAWGERPAFGWLVRERPDAPRGDEPGPFKLCYLLFSEP